SLILAAEDDRLTLPRMLQQVFREIEPRIGKEGGTGHPVAIHQRASAPLSDDTAKIPNQRPERLGLLDRPPVEASVIRKCTAGDACRLFHETRHRSIGNSLTRGRPKRLSMIHRHPPNTGSAYAHEGETRQGRRSRDPFSLRRPLRLITLLLNSAIRA